MYALNFVVLLEYPSDNTPGTIELICLYLSQKSYCFSLACVRILPLIDDGLVIMVIIYQQILKEER